jgi:hypothetical protein
MSNLNVSTFLPSLGKVSRTLFFEKNKFKNSQGMFKQIFLLKIFTKKILGTNVHKMYECDKNQMPYYNVIFFKK